MPARAPLEVELLSGSTRLGLHGAITAPSSALMGWRASSKSLTARTRARLAALWPRRCHRRWFRAPAARALRLQRRRASRSSEGRRLCPPRSQNSGRNRDGDGDRVSTPSRKCVNRIAELNAVGQQQCDQGKCVSSATNLSALHMQNNSVPPFCCSSGDQALAH